MGFVARIGRSPTKTLLRCLWTGSAARIGGRSPSNPAPETVECVDLSCADRGLNSPGIGLVDLALVDLPGVRVKGLDLETVSERPPRGRR